MNMIEHAKSFLRNRRISYKVAFGGPHGKAVLEDLAKFCRASESCFHPDQRIHAALEGRREVWLRILEHVKLSEEELEALHIPHKKGV